MELFKFTSPLGPTYFTGGEPILGATSTIWTERYREPGDFKLEAPLHAGLRTFLPIGTVISHTHTLETMIVEDHQISESADAEPIVQITGRSFEAFLEKRFVGANQNWATHAGLKLEYILAVAKTWDQAVTLINAHIQSGVTVDANNALPNIIATNDSISGTATTEARTIDRGSVLTRLQELLAVDDLGIKVVRRNNFGVIGSSTESWLLIHKGEDKSANVIFSSDQGDITNAEYLKSCKTCKNAALVTGRFVETAVLPIIETGMERFWMHVDASDIDGNLTSVPTGGTLTTIRNKMAIRGRQALKGNNDINIINVEISKNSQYKYREHYAIGDIVSVDGNYGEIEKRRVVEFIEVEDENGESGIPTLAELI